MSYSVPLSRYRSPSDSRSSSTAIAGYESSSVGASTRRYTPSIQASTRSTSATAAANEDQYEVGKPALDDDAALLTVSVPTDSAKVEVNGRKTTSDGTLRQFMSRGLKEGFLYTYVVKVTYDHDGETKTESREVKLRPGDEERIVFEAPTGVEPAVEELSSADVPTEQVVTVVKLHVPADAKVNLGGNDTNGSGSLRTFRTTQLKAGDRWSDYTVRVTSKVNGQLVSKERTISVEAGSTNELSFDFDKSTVAKR